MTGKTSNQNLDLLQNIRTASYAVRGLSLAQRNQVLKDLGQKIIAQKQAILHANGEDVAAFRISEQFNQALLDRLILTESRLQAMVQSLAAVEAMPDPLGDLPNQRILSNGLLLRQRRDPFGVILFIFEARPNVISEAFSLAFKSGNAMIFKNGKEAERTSSVLYSLIQQTLTENKIPADAFAGLSQASHEDIFWLLKQDRWIDLVIPRGGDHLIKIVKENSRIPVIQNDRGLCHLYVDSEANMEMALAILKNGKMQRPGVCNAIETLLVHESLASSFLPKAQEVIPGVQWWVSAEGVRYFSASNLVNQALPTTFDQEYLSLQLSCRLVASVEEAILHIREHGSKHSEAIITENEKTARRFQREVDAAVVYWNSSTRFTDGFEFGFGGEIGISTQKLHVRGPVGLEALTTTRWLVDGKGQIRP